jgi:Ca-activated chloride channel family protein
VAEQLALKITLGQATIPATAQPRLVYVLFEVAPAGARPPDRRRLPVNLGLVVDVSQSMQVPIITPEQFEWLARQGRVREMMVDGLPVWHVETPPRGFGRDLPTSVSHVQRALAEVAERLRAGDRSCLVAFASQAQTLVPGITGPDRLPRAVIEGLAHLDLGDQTYMARGLELGLQEVQRGQAPGWVSRILVLTDGFTLDASVCQALAQQARRAGVAMSTIGLGVEFNEELLIGLAEISGGHAYFVHHPQEIPDAFAQELRHLEAVAFRNLEIKLALTPGTELRRAYRVRPALAHLGEVPSEGGSVNLFLGDLEWATPPAVLLELIVPPRAPGAYRLCQAVLAYDDPDLPAEKVRQDVVLTYSADPAALAPADATVTGLVERATALALQTQALQQAAQGDLAGATVKLRAAATRLLALGEAELAQAALREADGLERGQQMSAQGRKEMRYTTRRLTQPLQ